MSDCIIQISWDNSFYGSGLIVGVALDGCDVGTLKNGEELRAVAAPGQHELSFYRYRRLDKTISFTIAEGQQNAFFTIKINASNRVDVVGGLKTKKQAKRPMNCTPFVRQYDILSNKWGVLLCQKEYQTNDIRRNSKNW